MDDGGVPMTHGVYFAMVLRAARIMVPLLLVFVAGCAAPLDLARKDFAASLRVDAALAARFPTMPGGTP